MVLCSTFVTTFQYLLLKRAYVAIEHAKAETQHKDPNLEIPLWILMVALPAAALYTIFRLYILVADFISMRELPASAFMTIDWSTYLPHI